MRASFFYRYLIPNPNPNPNISDQGLFPCSWVGHTNAVAKAQSPVSPTEALQNSNDVTTDLKSACCFSVAGIQTSEAAAVEIVSEFRKSNEMIARKAPADVALESPVSSLSVHVSDSESVESIESVENCSASETIEETETTEIVRLQSKLFTAIEARETDAARWKEMSKELARTVLELAKKDEELDVFKARAKEQAAQEHDNHQELVTILSEHDDLSTLLSEKMRVLTQTDEDGLFANMSNQEPKVSPMSAEPPKRPISPSARLMTPTVSWMARNSPNLDQAPLMSSLTDWKGELRPTEHSHSPRADKARTKSPMTRSPVLTPKRQPVITAMTDTMRRKVRDAEGSEADANWHHTLRRTDDWDTDSPSSSFSYGSPVTLPHRNMSPITPAGMYRSASPLLRGMPDDRPLTPRKLVATPNRIPVTTATTEARESVCLTSMEATAQKCMDWGTTLRQQCKHKTGSKSWQGSVVTPEGVPHNYWQSSGEKIFGSMPTAFRKREKEKGHKDSTNDSLSTQYHEERGVTPPTTAPGIQKTPTNTGTSDGSESMTTPITERGGSIAGSKYPPGSWQAKLAATPRKMASSKYVHN